MKNSARNRHAIETVADAIREETDVDNFTMVHLGKYFNDLPCDSDGNLNCDSIGCIAGWTRHIFGPAPNPTPHMVVAHHFAIDPDDAFFLCYPRHLETRSREEAADVLEHLSRTGHVNWDNNVEDERNI